MLWIVSTRLITKYYCLFYAEAIPIPTEQPIMQIKDLEDVIIPTMDIKVNVIKW